MKAPLLAAVLGFLAVLPLAAQIGIPATPKKFDTTRIGDAASGGSSVNVAPLKPPPPVVKTITHIIFGEPRQWKMADGKSYIGKLIAFEDIVAVGNAAALDVPKNPTVVRDGKVRLFVDGKSYEVPLQNFGADERKFIEDTRAAIAAKK